MRLAFTVLFLSTLVQLNAQVWQPDLRDGTYRNPIIHADYSDPDVVRVGDDFYLTASSFNCAPALPILHSTDLVNWEVFLQVKVTEGGKCQFLYRLNGETFLPIGDTFMAREGKWIGAKVGLFSIRDEHENNGGYADFDWFRITP
jgi:beta-xylosidase